MKKIEITARERVDAPAEFLRNGIVAFQIVDFKINYYGSAVETSHDTRLMEDGKQFVIGGCGYIKDGYEIK